MFAGCVMPKGFSLGDHFHTKEVEDMRYMFYQSSVSEAFDFGKIFDTSHVMNMEYMFSECRIPDGLKFPEVPDCTGNEYGSHVLRECVPWESGFWRRLCCIAGHEHERYVHGLHVRGREDR